MKLKIRYENEMQTIELDDAATEQLWVSLSLEGEEAPEEERERMIQFAFDLKFNRPEYNCWHRETRYIDPSPKCRLMDGSRGLIRGDEESGGFDVMTDCFQPIEKYFRVTYLLLKELNRRRIGYLIVTKSAMAAKPEYTDLYDPDLAHIQITITSTDDDKALEYENASPVSERIAAAEKLQEMGFDVSIRLSPFIPEYVDFDRLNSIKCDKIVVEFLRSNAFIRKSFPIDYSKYTVKSGGYRHLPLEKKKALISMITGFREVTVCEDEPEAYEYWKHHFNPDPDDCCNLRKGLSICRRAQ